MHFNTRLKMSLATIAMAAGFSGNGVAQTGILNPANPASPLYLLNSLAASSQAGNPAPAEKATVIIMRGQEAIIIVPQPGQVVDVSRITAAWDDVVRVVADPNSSAADLKAAMNGIVFANVEPEDADFIDAARKISGPSPQAQELIISMRNARIAKIQAEERQNAQNIFLAGTGIFAFIGLAGLGMIYRVNKKPSP